MTANDLHLLRQFTRDQSQDAFTALVQRQVNLVYAIAKMQHCFPHEMNLLGTDGTERREAT